MESLRDKRVTVVGLGDSGFAAARLLIDQGARVTLNDARDGSKLGARVAELAHLGAQLDLGGHDAERLAQNDLIVVSPGVPQLPELSAAEARGVKLVSEIELASWFIESTV